ncbi:LacI family DNA-binding transcriptional regulator [Paenibacillus sp. YN15]|uniref:LacI family DNA-binding transcriptional regulator n=1 Tax=Paenibacillus sp. YN15 TaxID=1742774 RepID=UPI0015ECD1F6|nr:LacI family DNA-binding transcriptional regulator [Paenibacillus sp. YN15]
MRKRVTASDVARRAGVSRSLVSAFLNSTPGITVSAENRAAITSAIRELGYTVNVQAQSIKTGRSNCIAVYGDVYNALFLQLVEGVQRASGPAGYHVLLYGQGRNMEGREGLTALYRQGRIDGVITLDFPEPLNPSWEEAVREWGIPYVTVEGIPASPEILSVETDYAASIRQALEFMEAEGWASPVYLNVLPSDRPQTRGDRQRLEAYESWMREKGRQPRVYPVPDEPWSRRRGWWREWLAAQKLPLGVLSNWSRGALHVYRAAHEQGLQIGRQLFVMSADDTERVSRHMIPAVPCIEIPYGEMGEAAFALLHQAMAGRGGTAGVASAGDGANVAAVASVGDGANVAGAAGAGNGASVAGATGASDGADATGAAGASEGASAAGVDGVRCAANGVHVERAANAAPKNAAAEIRRVVEARLFTGKE